MKLTLLLKLSLLLTTLTWTLSIRKNKSFLQMYKDEPKKAEPEKKEAPAAPSSPASEIVQDWLSISSTSFQNKNRFPRLKLPNGQIAEFNIDSKNKLLNAFYSDARKQTEAYPKSKDLFYFRLSKDLLYFSATSSDINIIGAISISQIIKSENTSNNCFVISDKENTKYTLCAGIDSTSIDAKRNKEIKNKFVCSIYKFQLHTLPEECTEKKKIEESKESKEGPKATEIDKIEERKIFLIPTPAPMCNADWTYKSKGKDWNCICEEGIEQSPIVLPDMDEVVHSDIAPWFKFYDIKFSTDFKDWNGKKFKEEKQQIVYENNAIRIKNKRIGKIVTLDGAVYVGEEIIFHTPAEHKIAGKKDLDMEMEIVYYGKSKGDINKQVVLSFLFEKKPGKYNKFFDSFDIHDLPNPLFPSKDFTSNLYVPKLFFDSDSKENVELIPFSFYTYQGSLSSPPCTERTIRYVVSEPIPWSKLIIDEFKEALKMPDMREVKHNANDMNTTGDMSRKEEYGNVYSSNVDKIDNVRTVQELNDRSVFFWDHTKYCNLKKESVKEEENIGHYEKVFRKATQYYYVNTNQPTGLPGSFVIEKEEAIGDLEKR